MRVYDKRMARMLVKDDEALAVSQQVKDDFYRRINQTDSCWLWIGNPTAHGYGVFYYGDGLKMQAHRFALLHAEGKPPPGAVYYACHRCESKNCVNPSHQYWGTPKQNIEDAYQDPKRHTEEHRLRSKYHERLSNDAVREMWHKYYFENATQKDLGSEYDCNVRYVAEIMRGNYRSHITKHLPRPTTPRVARMTTRVDRRAQCVFTETQVQAIRRALACGVTELDMAAITGMDRGPITAIAVGRSWSHLAWPEGCRPRKQAEGYIRSEASPVRNVKARRLRTDLTGNEIREIYNAYWYRNISQRKIAVDYGTTNAVVSFIANKKFGQQHTVDLVPNDQRKNIAPLHVKLGRGPCKMTADQVQEIRRYILAELPDRLIAAKYDRVSVDMVRLIRVRKTWGRLPWPSPSTLK